MTSRQPTPAPASTLRLGLVYVLLLAGAGVLLWRMVDLHVFNHEFLRGEGEARHLRVVSVPAHRGMITDRYGEPLAISTPVDAVWANPQALLAARERLPELAQVLDLDPQRLAQQVEARHDRQFMYLRRQLPPEVAARATALGLPGVALQREYRRYYPGGPVTAHVLGFTNIDDVGQEGIELAYEQWLRGTAGSKRVIRDRLGRIVENVESIREPRPGKDLALTLDRRLQYLAHRALESAVQEHQAVAGSVVILDARTAEVLAMVNQPSYNPNNRRDLGSERLRNRAVTDAFEPGSTVKPFTVAAALEAGTISPDSRINTAPGVLRVGRATVRDIRNYGVIDAAALVQKSSNVGASKLALGMPPDALWGMYSRLGFGEPSGSGFPGEAAGQLVFQSRWSDVERATLSFGYGLSVNALQLAQGYLALAGDGSWLPATFITGNGREREILRRQAMAPHTAQLVRAMLEGAVHDQGGTATLARVRGYRVAGKTGTAKKAQPGGYAEDRYVSLFAGFAPVSDPRLVMVVMIDEPRGDEYYGGRVAAPVFGTVMADALRLLDVPPDDLPSLGGRVMAQTDPSVRAARLPQENKR
ncbi:penicillin-binding protein 2 [Ectothiorhodospiraceae bacterium 2226]|nr:penicillin-binding protein 2 [Ectothiorhodospiraceae bacterium 2226]